MIISRQESYNIVIDTNGHTLTLYTDDELYKVYPIAVGRKGRPTPKGKFSIVQKSLNPGGPFGARWMGLSARHYGIHGTNKPDSIGKDVSKGCIRMYNEDAIELYDIVPLNTSVEII